MSWTVFENWGFSTAALGISMNIFSTIKNLLTSLFTHEDLNKKVVHSYFKNLSGGKSGNICSWYAQTPLPHPDGAYIITWIIGTPTGPTKAEEKFCRDIASDLDALFEKCRLAFSTEFQKLTRRSIPAEWKDTFEINELEVPSGGDSANAWQVTYVVEQIGKEFTAIFENGKIVQIVVCDF